MIAQTPLPTGSVSATYFAGVLQFAVACGAHRARLLADLGLRDADIAEGDSRLPLPLLRALFDRSAATLDDPAFALHFGVGVPCAQLTLASALAASRPDATSPERGTAPIEGPRTLRDALIGLNRYTALGVHLGAHAPVARYRFVDEANGVWLEDTRPDDDNERWPALTESVFARFATGIRRRGGEEVVRALDVTHDAPADERHRAAYDLVFRVPVRFGAARNALCLDPRFLDEPLEPLAAPVEQVLTRHADAQLAGLVRHTGWRARVEAVLLAQLRDAGAGRRTAVSIMTVCRELAVSRQTLHRRLRVEGTTFAALHDTARRQLADALLRTDRLPVTVVSARLGFSEPAAFSRAYKRWTGVRPSSVLMRSPLTSPHTLTVMRGQAGSRG